MICLFELFEVFSNVLFTIVIDFNYTVHNLVPLTEFVNSGKLSIVVKFYLYTVYTVYRVEIYR